MNLFDVIVRNCGIIAKIYMSTIVRDVKQQTPYY